MTDSVAPPTVPTCPECGSTDFARWEGGNYTERHTLSFSGSPDKIDVAHEWDKQNQDVMSSEPWECWPYKHPAPDDLAALIEEAMEAG